MANPSVVILQLAAASANGISTSQTPGGAGNLTITGSLASGGVATLDVARRVLISTAGADSARTFTIFGTDRNGNTQSETITGISTGTSAFTARDFKTVTRVAVDAATAGAVTVGTNAVGSSDWVVDDFFAKCWDLAGGVSGPAGTTYTVEATYDDPNKVGTTLVPPPYGFAMEPASRVPPLAWPHPIIAGVAGNQQFNYANNPIFAHRLTINSGTGQVVMQSIQSGIGGW